jgi:hypothetical protein
MTTTCTRSTRSSTCTYMYMYYVYNCHVVSRPFASLYLVHTRIPYSVSTCTQVTVQNPLVPAWVQESIHPCVDMLISIGVRNAFGTCQLSAMLIAVQFKQVRIIRIRIIRTAAVWSDCTSRLTPRSVTYSSLGEGRKHQSMADPISFES